MPSPIRSASVFDIFGSGFCCTSSSFGHMNMIAPGRLLRFLFLLFLFLLQQLLGVRGDDLVFKI